MISTFRVSIYRAGYVWKRKYHFQLLNLKIGYTKAVEPHPDSDKLYVSQLKLDNSDSLKQVCSGLRNYISRDSLQDQLVVVVDNMKKCKLRGKISEAMILCGESPSNELVSLCKPAEFNMGLIGKQVVLQTKDGTAEKIEPTNRKLKSKEWEDICSKLRVGEGGEIIYEEEETGSERQLCVYDESGESIPIISEGLPAGSAVR